MQAEAPPKSGSRDGNSKWGTAEASELHPGDSGLAQSLRFYVAHANAGTRNASDSPLVSELFRSSPEVHTAAVAALVAEREDRLLHLLRSYGCAVVLANFIITFIFSIAVLFYINANAPINPEAFPSSFALTPNIQVIPAAPSTKLEEALANPRSVIITAFDAGGFAAVYRHDVVGWEASRARGTAILFLSANRRLVLTSTTIFFEDGLTGLGLAEWDLLDSDTDSAPHKVLRDALHAAGDGGAAAAAPAAAAAAAAAAAPIEASEGETPQEVQQGSASASATKGAPARRLDVATNMTTSSQPLHFSPSNQIPSFWHDAPLMQPQTRQRFPGFPPFVVW